MICFGLLSTRVVSEQVQSDKNVSKCLGIETINKAGLSY